MYFWEWMMAESKKAGLHSDSDDADECNSTQASGSTIFDSISGQPSDNGSIYEINEQHLDLRSPSEEQRGYMTAFYLAGLSMMLWTLGSALAIHANRWSSGEFYLNS